jgi:HK97 family phage major capsid protein
VNVRTIAVWIPATRRIVSDAQLLRQYIDDYLRQDIYEEVEDQVVTGSGAAENFTGILNTVGIGDAGAPGAGESALDVIREAKGLVQTNARTNPTAVLLNPADAEKVDKLKINSEVNHFISPPFGPSAQRVLWGMAVVETSAVPAGTGLAGDFRKAVLFDREDVEITLGTASDDFIRNLLRVLGELRAGFVVQRASAFAKFTVP